LLDWLKCLVDECEHKGIPPGAFAIVIDNAPTHSMAEKLLSIEMAFRSFTWGHIAYAALNRIEACWFVVKSYIKRQLSPLQGLLRLLTDLES
jgi:hypothetical protein